MQRNMELVRAILRRAEEQTEPFFPQVDGFDARTIAGHVVIMQEAGLLAASILGSTGNPTAAQVLRLTWSGHDLLQAIGNETVWRKTLAFVAEKGGGLTLEIVKGVALTFLKAQIGVPLG